MTPCPIPFAKAHALGNDFLLVEEASLGGVMPESLARCLCDRHTGVGADGLVVLDCSSIVATRFRIYNPDGSEAALSANALRCAAALLLSRGRPTAASSASVATPPAGDAARFEGAGIQSRDVSAGKMIALETRAGVRRLFFLGLRDKAWVFRSEIGKPSFAAADVPFRSPRAVTEPLVDIALPVGDSTAVATILSMGNPQCILFVEDWAATDWLGLGMELERHPFFPDRTNVGFVRVVRRDRIEARFWERGVGHTLASGTGSCACVVAGNLAGMVERRVSVAVERGEMEVNWREDGVMELTGPAELVAEGNYSWSESP